MTYMNLEFLPPDLLSTLASVTDATSLSRMSGVNKSWCKLFKNNHFWKTKILQNFDINPENLSRLPLLANDDSLYKYLYIRLYYLDKFYHKLPTDVQYIYGDPDKELLVLVACLNNAEIVYKNISCDEHLVILLLSISAGCCNIELLQQVEKTLTTYSKLFKQALIVGNLEVVRFLLHLFRPLLARKDQLAALPKQDSLNMAARSGSLKLVQFLLHPENNLNLKPNQDTLNCSAYSGNSKLVDYFLSPENEFNLIANHLTLNNAVLSRNFDLVCSLLNNDRFKIKPTHKTLKTAAEIGSLRMVKFLLQSKEFHLSLDLEILHSGLKSSNLDLVYWLLSSNNQFKLAPDHKALCITAKMGNLEIMRFLLDTQNRFNLKPQTDVVEHAAASDNVELMKYLLEPENGFKLRPTYVALANAIEFGNFESTQYLLDRKNNFELYCHYSRLEDAIKSQNIKLIRYLLNPMNKLNLKPTLNTLEYVSYQNNNVSESLKKLLSSNIAMHKAIEELVEGNLEMAAESLKKSFEHCQDHFSQWKKYFLDDSNVAKLSSQNRSFLLTTCEKIEIGAADQFKEISLSKAMG